MPQHPTLREALRPPIVGLIWAVFVAGALLLVHDWGLLIALGSLISLVVHRRAREPEGRCYRWSSGVSAAILVGLFPLYVFAPMERTWMAVVALLSGVPAIVAIVIETKRDRTHTLVESSQ